MKTLFFLYTVLAAMILSHSSIAATKTKPVQFRYAAADMELKTEGKTIHKAREVASEQCFSKRMTEYRKRRGQGPNDEQALLIIDSCVNI